MTGNSSDSAENRTRAEENRPRTEQDHIDAAREALIAAMLPHVPFDGWSKEAITMALGDSGVDPGLARLAFPRGGLDAAMAFHRRGDRLMKDALAAAPLADMKIRERVTFAVRTRLEVAEPDREAVRRGATMLALPIHAAEGVRAIWGTADAIWSALGDESRDINWYSKRATLSGVYSAVVLYWLADESERRADTWAFLDRRIEDVMRIEKAKAQLRASPLGRILGGVAERAAGAVRAPGSTPEGRRFGFPGPRR
jgi:ubiquinone biosynthesis protein COQ9